VKIWLVKITEDFNEPQDLAINVKHGKHKAHTNMVGLRMYSQKLDLKAISVEILERVEIPSGVSLKFQPFNGSTAIQFMTFQATTLKHLLKKKKKRRQEAKRQFMTEVWTMLGLNGRHKKALCAKIGCLRIHTNTVFYQRLSQMQTLFLTSVGIQIMNQSHGATQPIQTLGGNSVRNLKKVTQKVYGE
jgi:hypothetical protein